MQSREFKIVVRGATIELTGSPTGLLGHRIPDDGDAADGVFFEWDWDGQRLAARNDRLGMHPAFWAATGNGIAIADNVTSLIRMGASCAFDAPAMAAFLHLGFFLGDDTPFRGVRALPPGAELVWTPSDGARVDAPDFSPPAAFAGSRQTAIETYADLFRDAVRRRVPDRSQVIVPLSGGRDSRHILFELVRAGIRPLCITGRKLPPQPDEDVRVAALLARTLGLRHEVVAQTPSLFQAEQAKNLATGFCSDEGAWTMHLAARLQGADAAIYDGLGGDVLSAGLFATPQHCEAARSRDPDQFAHACIRFRTCEDGFGEDAVRQVLSDRAYAEFGLPVALERIRREAVHHFDLPNPVASFYFFNRTRREMALFPYLVLARGNSVFCPYIDQPLVRFLLSLPLELVIDRQLHTDTIAQAFPEFESLPYEDKAAAGPSAIALRAQFGRQVARSSFAHGLAGSLRIARLVPRLLRALADRGYAADMYWYAGSVQYMNQIAATCRSSGVDRRL